MFPRRHHRLHVSSSLTIQSYRPCLVALVTLLVVSTESLAAPPRFTIQDLGPAPPAINGFPVMNDLGQVSFMQPNGALALYTDSVGVENPIPWIPVGSGIMPAGINNRGDIVFNHGLPGQNNVSSQLYQAGIGLTPIATNFVASDINNEGVVVGSTQNTGIPRVYRNGLLENLPLALGSSA